MTRRGLGYIPGFVRQAQAGAKREEKARQRRAQQALATADWTWLERDVEKSVRAGALVEAADLARLADECERRRTPVIAAVIGGERDLNVLFLLLRGAVSPLCLRCKGVVVNEVGLLCPDCRREIEALRAEIDALTSRGTMQVSVTWQGSFAGTRGSQAAGLCQRHALMILEGHAEARLIRPASESAMCAMCEYERDYPRM